jgi:hypothetical protein
MARRRFQRGGLNPPREGKAVDSLMARGYHPSRRVHPSRAKMRGHRHIEAIQDAPAGRRGPGTTITIIRGQFAQLHTASHRDFRAICCEVAEGCTQPAQTVNGIRRSIADSKTSTARAGQVLHEGHYDSARAEFDREEKCRGVVRKIHSQPGSDAAYYVAQRQGLGLPPRGRPARFRQPGRGRTGTAAGTLPDPRGDAAHHRSRSGTTPHILLDTFRRRGSAAAIAGLPVFNLLLDLGAIPDLASSSARGCVRWLPLTERLSPQPRVSTAKP